MRISDWSSDVCSSDLADEVLTLAVLHRLDGAFGGQLLEIGHFALAHHLALAALHHVALLSEGRKGAQDGDDGYDRNAPHSRNSRSEERRVGKECVGPCRSRGSPLH